MSVSISQLATQSELALASYANLTLLPLTETSQQDALRNKVMGSDTINKVMGSDTIIQNQSRTIHKPLQPKMPRKAHEMCVFNLEQ
jgi:hypothetical protein